MPKIPEDINADITPEKFETLVHDYLKSLGETLTNFEAVHNVSMQSHDGTYQIDVKASFEALNVSFVVLVECKKHTSPIKRETVQILHTKVNSLGAHKGIIFSTASFQQGAKDYAKQHGIALVRIIEGRYLYQTKSFEKQTHNLPPWVDIPEYVGEYNFKENHYTNLHPGNMDELKDFIFSDKKHST